MTYLPTCNDIHFHINIPPTLTINLTIAFKIIHYQFKSLIWRTRSNPDMTRSPTCTMTHFINHPASSLYYSSDAVISEFPTLCSLSLLSHESPNPPFLSKTTPVMTSSTRTSISARFITSLLISSCTLLPSFLLITAISASHHPFLRLSRTHCCKGSTFDW